MNRIWSEIISAKLLFVLVAMAGFVLLSISSPSQVTAQTAETLNFQGKIVRNDSGSEGINVSSSETSCISAGADTCGFQVVYYDAASAGNTLASETFTSIEIGDNDGVFNLTLGTGTFTAGTETSFLDIYQNNSTVYSEIRFDHDGNATYTETFGRMANRATPFALRADVADTINGFDEADFVQFAPSTIQTDASISSSIFINKTGASGNMLQLQKNGTDAFVVDNSGQVGIGVTVPATALDVAGTLLLDSGTSNAPTLTWRQNSTTGFYMNAATGGAVVYASGSQDRYWFTTNYITSDTLYGFYITRTAGSSTVPVYSFWQDSDTGIGRSADNELSIITQGAESIRIDSTGKVGIGDPTPASLFTVGSGDLFQVSSSGAIAAVKGITNTGVVASTGGVYSINVSSNFATNINTGTTTGGVTIGGGSGSVAVNSTTWDISTTGAATGFTGITSSGTITFSGLSTGIVVNSSGLLSSSSPTCSGTNKLAWNGTSFTCTTDLVDDADASTINELQDLFSTIAVSGQSDVVADANSDTLTFVAGTNITLTTSAVGDSVTIAGTGTTYTAGNDIDFSGTQVDIEPTLNFVTTITRASSNLTLSTTTTGNIELSPAGYVGVAGSIIAGTDDTYDLGSTSFRWRDVYIGPSSLHIGTSVTDEGLISYDTTGNIFNFGTDSTTNADIAFNLNNLYIDKSSSKIGIGTTTPDAQLQIVGSIGTSSGGNLYHWSDVAHYSDSGNPTTGTLKITLPQSWTNTMMKIEIEGYAYEGTNGAWTATVSGYSYTGTPAWIYTDAEITGKAPFTSVRLAHDGTSNVILLGTTSTTWYYPKIVVTNVTTGHSNYADWGDGWSMSIISSETGITNINTPSAIPSFNVGVTDSTPPFTVDSTYKITNLNADLLDNASANASASVDTIVQRSSLGYIYANYFNTTAATTTNAASHIAVQTGTDGFIRWQTPSYVRSSLGLGTTDSVSFSGLTILDATVHFSSSNSGDTYFDYSGGYNYISHTTSTNTVFRAWDGLSSYSNQLTIEGATGKIDISGGIYDSGSTLLLDDSVEILNYLYHKNDLNTYIGYDANDSFTAVVNGIEKFSANTGGTSIYLGHQNSTIEGGQVNFVPGTSYSYPWFIDQYGNGLRAISAAIIDVTFNCENVAVGYDCNITTDGTASDFAETVTTVEPVDGGDIVSTVSADNEDGFAVVKGQVSNQKSIIGVISTVPGVTLKAPLIDEGTGEVYKGTLVGKYNSEMFNRVSNLKPLSLAGRVPVKVIIDSNQVIGNGDFIVASNVAGFGTSAVNQGVSVGKTIQTFDPTELSCSQVSSISSISWPADDGTNQSRPCFKLPDGRYVGKVMIFVETTYYNPVSESPLFAQMVQDYEDGLLGGLSGAGDTIIGDTLSIGSGFSVDTTGNLTVAGDILLLGGLLGGPDGIISIEADLTALQITAEKYNVDTSDGAAASAGKTTIPAGFTSITVDTTALTAESLIFITPEIAVTVGSIAVDMDTFKISIAAPLAADLDVSWWIVN